MHNCALVIGCAADVWKEVEEAKRLHDFDLYIAVNSAGVDFPEHVDHWVSFHIDLLPHWSSLRTQRGFSEVTSFWSAIYRGSPLSLKAKLPIQRIPCNGGSSGLIGALVAVKLARGAALAGMHMA